MTTTGRNWYQRTDPKPGLWEHRGKVAFVGRGHSPIDRRWDGVSMDQTLGAYAMIAARDAMDDAGVAMDDIDGILTCPGGQPNGGTIGDLWGPRPYFEPPYDSEDGLTKVTAEWLNRQMGFKNATYLDSDGDFIWHLMSRAFQVVGDGLAKTLLVVYPCGNLAGRYHHEPGDYARGMTQWTNPWGWGFLPGIAHTFDQYCRKYGSSHDRLAPFIVNQHRNGLMVPWGYYSQHQPEPFTTEDYLSARWVVKPMGLWDADRPVQQVACYIVTTAERAKDLKQKPVYVLDHTESNNRARSSMETLEEVEEWNAGFASKAYAGSGLSPKDIDIFNPYDGFGLFTQYFLEAFQWHGVKKGEAHDFYADDIRVEGPHPFFSSGGNLGTGRTRTAIFTDCMEQLQGRAGQRQVSVKAEIAVAVGPLPSICATQVYSIYPD